MKPNIGITEKNLRSVSIELNKLLADQVVLYFQTRNYHWNIEGENFSDMHIFYECQFKELDDIMDAVAERIRMIGHYTDARLVDYLKLTHLVEPAYTNVQSEQTRNLIVSHETIIRNLRKLISRFDQYRDVGSSDFLTQLISRHEKMAWMLRAHLS